MKKLAIILIVAILASLVLGVLPVAGAVPYVVKTETDYRATAYNGHRTLARKSNGDLWCVYARVINALRVFAAYSTDGGETWTEEQVGYVQGYEQRNPAIAIDSEDNIHVVWWGMGWGDNPTKTNIHYRKRTSTWQTVEHITDEVENQDGEYLGIAIDSDDNVHVAWDGYGWGTYTEKQNIQYRKRTTSWQTQEGVTDVDGNQCGLSMAIDSSNNVHLAWDGLGWGVNTGISNIQYRKRTTSWQTQEGITDVATGQYQPCIAIDSEGNVHVVWRGLGWGTNTGIFNIQYRKRTTSWQTQEDITDIAVYDQYAPSLALDRSDYIHVVWYGQGWGTYTEKANIQYRQKTTSWQTQEGVTDRNHAQWYANLIWAYHPVDTHISYTGYALVWSGTIDSGGQVEYFASDDTWTVPPTVTTSAASSIAETTARLNSTIVNDGDGDVTVRFGWGLTSKATIEAYDDYEAVAGTFNTGEHPYLDVDSLTADTLYYFRVEGTNAIGTDLGAELSFTTEAGLADVTNFKAIPVTTTISLTWASATGASRYMVRYKIGSYAVNETDGTLVYFGVSTSTTHDYLTPGSTYYYGVWGESGGEYSDNGAFVLATTAAVVEGGEHLDPPIQPSRWISAPDYTNLSGLLFFYDAVNDSADALGMPRATFWMMLALGLSVGIGLLTYLVSKGKLLIAFIALTVALFFGWIILIIPFWIPLLSIILIVAYFIAHREVAY